MSTPADALAQRLQDAVLSPLAAVAARLDSVLALTREQQVQRRVAEVTEELARIAAALRAQLRELASGGDTGASTSLRDIVSDAGQRIGCAPRLQLDAALDDVDAALLEDVTGVLREATENVVRHAYAGSLEVTVTVGASLTVLVVDDGVGPNEEPTSGTGLSRLASLAQARGGQCAIAANTEGFGSTLTWSVPV